MSGFTALNIEPEDTIEDEIDDTKEIQIEEAFKLYQNALKLHSQGPGFYTAAGAAYAELFQSEVFKYPEVVSDYSHDQLDDAVVTAGAAFEQDPVPLIISNAADSAANSLPQLIYLAYKSRAQFVLDSAHNESEITPSDRRALCDYYYAFCLKSFRDSASALESDDTDIDLWKKAARIAEALGSQRLVRFCLESVVAGDDEGGEQAIDLSGLDEAFASGELEQVLQLVQDDLFQSDQTSVRPKHPLMQMLQKSNDPYPFLPERPKALDYLNDKQRPNTFKVGKIELAPADRTLQSLGTTILSALERTESGLGASGASGCVSILLPFRPQGDDTDSRMIEVDVAAGPEDVPIDAQNGRATAEASSPAESAKSPASFHSAQDELSQDFKNEPGAENKVARTDNVEGEAVEPQPEAGKGSVDAAEIRLPTRKRSSTAAGLEEHESRTKSKRLRARESLALEHQALEDEAANDLQEYNQEQLRIIEDADEISINYLNRLLERFVETGFGSCTDVRNEFWQENEGSDTPINNVAPRIDSLLWNDMRHALTEWNDERSGATISGHSTRDLNEKASGLALFLRHLKAKLPKDSGVSATGHEALMLDTFMQSAAKTSLDIFGVALLWILALLTDRYTSPGQPSPYIEVRWAPDLRKTLIQIVNIVNDQLIETVAGYTLSEHEDEQAALLPWWRECSTAQATELVQSLFEIHLDEYVSITNPESQASDADKARQLSCVQKWAQLSTEFIQAYYQPTNNPDIVDPLILRYIWTSVRLTSQMAGDDKSHVLVCLVDLKLLIEQAGRPIITLPNNTAIPQISLAAIEQETSRLSTLDFFMSVFDSDGNDPVAVVMKLEPILEPGSVASEDANASSTTENDEKSGELRAFLNSGDASLKLFLWRRLQDAYTAISYTPKVVSCLLRSFETIVGELQSDRHVGQDAVERQLAMFRWLRDADELVIRIVSKITDDGNAFESLDADHLRSSTGAAVFMLRLLHGFVIYDDAVRVGQMAAPSLRASSAKLFEKSKDRLREAYVRLWTLLFYLIKEATVQFQDRFERTADELAEYLRNVHNALGHRQYCKHCNKLFVKLVKAELLALDSDIDYSQDIAQILYDMYQLKFSPGIGDADHGCTPELLRDKTTAMTLVPLIMSYAKRINPRDLIKSELKTTIDKIQQCLGQVKTSSALSFNKKAISAFLKGPINPQTLYRAMKGIGDLITKPVHGDFAKIAATGWYFLLGQMSLAKFRSIKRVSPTPTDDLDVAGTFLRHDLEHDLTSWQTWHRLAQVFDAKIEDCLIWNSTKLNDARPEIVVLERSAINAYTMAITMAMREADDSKDAVQELSDMFAEFAMRLYASSRPPLNMEAFSTDKHMRHLSSSLDQSMSKVPFVPPFRPYILWRFAAGLLRRRFTEHAKEWLCHYTLSKCLWKMFQDDENKTAKHPVMVDQIIDALTDAVERVPKKEKSSDPIIEPHYKIISVIHKLVHAKFLDPHRAMECLRVTHFATGARVDEDEHGRIEWEPYILDVLKKLGQADKSNWHHRITARAAHVIYDDDPNIAGALGAKHQFTLQIFTKTMTMQVWKPEYERAGRHYVYTGRYLSFFVHLLEQLNDRSNMEQLVRRIRRKTTDFLNHTRVWEETALTYVKMLRRAANIGEGKERSLFDKIPYEEFTKMSEKLEKWCHELESPSSYMDIIHDAIELKKLNNSLMKGSAIDDLIGDAYATMYELFVSQLPPDDASPPKSVLPQGTFINMTTESAPTGDDKVDRIRLNNLLSTQVDGSASAVSSALSNPVVLGVQTPNRDTPPVEPVRIPTPSKPGRAKTITRREVQRKAEAAINRPATSKTPTFKKISVDIPSLPHRGSAASNANAGDEEDHDRSKDKEQSDGQMDSRRSSLSIEARLSDAAEDDDGPKEPHDAEANEDDDESELSELSDMDDEKETARLLPGASDRKRKAEDDGEEELDSDDDAGQDGDEEDNDGEEGDDDDVESNDGQSPPEHQDASADGDQILEIEDSQEPGDDSDDGSN